MTMRLRKSDLFSCFQVNCKTPRELVLSFWNFFPDSIDHFLFCYVFHVPWWNNASQVELIETVARDGKFLKKLDFNSNLLSWWNISYFHREHVFCFGVDLSFSNLPSLFYCFFILLCGFLLVFDDPINFSWTKLSTKFVDACFRIDGKEVFHLKESIGWVEVWLSQSYFCDGVYHFYVIVCRCKRNKDMLFFWLQSL